MKDYITINKEAYDQLCEDYNRRATNKSEYEEKTEVLCSHILKLCEGEYINKTVLEVGPGSGEVLSFFEKKGFKTIAVELSKKMAGIAQKRAPKSMIIIANILEIDFLEEQFDIIYAGALIHLFPLQDARSLLTLFYRWLKKSGVLFINTTMCDSSNEGYEKKIEGVKEVVRYRRKWKREELYQSLVQNGFQPIDTLYTDEIDRNKHWVAYLCKKMWMS